MYSPTLSNMCTKNHPLLFLKRVRLIWCTAFPCVPVLLISYFLTHANQLHANAESPVCSVELINMSFNYLQTENICATEADKASFDTCSLAVQSNHPTPTQLFEGHGVANLDFKLVKDQNNFAAISFIFHARAILKTVGQIYLSMATRNG